MNEVNLKIKKECEEDVPDSLNPDSEATYILPDYPPSHQLLEPSLVKEEDAASVAECWDCAACSRNFSDKKSLRQHVVSSCYKSLFLPHKDVARKVAATTSKAGIFACANCPLAFTSRDSRDRHQRLSCRRRRLKEAVIAAPPPTEIPAALEPSATNGPGSDGRKTHKCGWRCYFADTSKSLAQHTAAQTPERGFACTECSYETAKNCTLKLHMQTVHKHSGPKPYKCDRCDFACNQSGNLKNHVRAVHTKERPFGCTECAFICVTSSHLTRHMLTHSGLKPYKCGQCGFACNERGNLKTHVDAVHTLKRPFACKDCSYTCAQKKYLTQHMVTHTGLKPYKCEHCNYASNQSGTLKCHIRSVHTSERPFACNKCSYTCAHKGNLTQHVLTHTGLKPYKCDQCDYASNLSSNLKNHVSAVHTKERPFACNVCPYTCAHKGNLAQHMATHVHVHELYG